MSKPTFSNFYLAGGTSLALQIGHRLSVDLDFFGQQPFEVQEILDELLDLLPVSIINQHKNILILNVQDVKVDFVNYRYQTIVPPKIIDGVRLLDLPDIGAMKLAAIAGRGKKRDFYDLYFLMEKYSLNKLMEFYLKKYPDGSEFIVARSLTYFEDADEDEEVQLLKKNIAWAEVKQKISAEVNKKYN